MSDNLEILYKGAVRFVSPPSKMMVDVARDLAASLPDNFARPGTVYVGAHRLGPLPDGHRSVGIQTEQFYDEQGRVLRHRALIRQRRILNLFNKYDHVLDLSYSNKKIYEGLGMEERLHFGPWVFPDQPYTYVTGSGPLVFFGSRSERREKVLNEIATRTSVELLPRGSFGDKLDTSVKNARAVLNIHYEDGVYSEVPRILSAYRAGKALVSEPLAAPFVSGKHYIPHDDPESVEPAVAFANLAELAQRYRFSDFLNSIF